MREIDLVIPVHGAAPYFNLTLESLLAANLQSVNTIVVLDRPNQDTRDLTESFVRKIDGFRVSESVAPGIVEALNHGISISDAKYIARLDADDLITSNRFEIQREFLNSRNEIAVLGSQMSFINIFNERIGSTSYPANFRDIRNLLEFQNCIAHPSVMMRRELFETVGGYRNCFTGAEDYDLWLRMSELGQLRNINFELTQYRISSSQFSRSPEANQGTVELAVKLSSIGYAPSGISFCERPTRASLEESNNINMKNLQQESIAEWRRLRRAREINYLWMNKKNTKKTIRALLSALLKSFFLSPRLTLRYIILKFKYHNSWKRS
jgi:glycosyltransferase involved in cell wall biosynthesis